MRPTLLGVGRAAYVVVAALLTATLLPRIGVPAGWVPDLVLLGVASSAVLRGPVHGALVGVAAGWVVELVPPVGSPLGLTPLVMMTGGLVAGLLHQPSSRSAARPLAALVAAGAVVGASRVATTIVAEGSVDLSASAGRIVSTVGVGLVLVPLMIAADRALVRRRLG